MTAPLFGRLLRRAAIGVACAAIATTALAAGGRVPERAAGDAPIRVVDDGYSIDYGRSIDFFVEAVSESSPITEIQAFFTPVGEGNIATYSYPDFTPGRRVRATFSIPTGVTAYFPPGVLFDVRYVIADAQGNSMETPTVRVEYLDPAFDWKRRELGGVTVVYHDRSRADVDRLLDAAARRLPRIAETLGLERPFAYRAILLNSTREAQRSFPKVSQADTAGHTFAGFAFSEYGLFVLSYPDPATFVHELTHLMFAAATPSVLAKRPSWVNEGLAVYFETGSSADSARRLKRAATRKELLPIRSLNTIPGKRRQITIFYAEAGNFVGFLLDEFGPDRFRALVSELDDGRSASDAVEAAYGRALESLQTQWEARLYGERFEPPAPVSPQVAGEPSEAAAAPPSEAAAARPEATSAGANAVPATRAAKVQSPTEDGSPRPVGNPGRQTRGLLIIAVGLVAVAFFGASRVRRALSRRKGRP